MLSFSDGSAFLYCLLLPVGRPARCFFQRQCLTHSKYPAASAARRTRSVHQSRGGTTRHTSASVQVSRRRPHQPSRHRAAQELQTAADPSGQRSRPGTAGGTGERHTATRPSHRRPVRGAQWASSDLAASWTTQQAPTTKRSGWEGRALETADSDTPRGSANSASFRY